MTNSPNRLWIEDVDTKKRLFVSENSPFTIGRLSKNDFSIINDLSISGVQIRIERCNADEWSIIPVSQTVATMLNGNRISTSSNLVPGDIIQFSGRSFRTGMGPEDTATVEDTTIVYGRDIEAVDVRLDHPTVSRRHAALTKDKGALTIKDLGSTNGTFLNGQPVGSDAVLLSEGCRVDIGPFSFVVSNGNLSPFRQRAGTPILVADNLTYVVIDRTTGNDLTLLDDVSVALNAGSFTCIIGESGSGKSTLIRQLSGRIKPQNGSVNVRGLDLSHHFEALKQDIAYVPQDDLLHHSLTLGDALAYTARLRLPVDQTENGVDDAVRAALDAVDLCDRIDTKLSDLSGGQKKRASLACELLTRPSLLLLDEVTSGLDEATDREVMQLLKRLASEGVTIVCVTHTLANIVDSADSLLVMSRGGVPAYYGKPDEALPHFGVDRLGQIFDRLADDTWERVAKSQNGNSPLGQISAAAGSKSFASPGVAEIARQFLILCSRNWKLKAVDRRGLGLAIFQAFTIGGLLGYAFSDFGDGAQIVQSKISLLTLLGMSALWIGCNSASQDIVGERTIYEREHDMGLSALAFVLSKFTITGLYTVAQLALVMALLSLGAEEIPGGIWAQFLIVALGGFVGVAIGLAISAWCQTRDQANIIVPLALIPQLILAGTLVPAIPDFGKTISEYLISAYWITEGMQSNFIAADGPVTTFDLSASRPATLDSETLSLAVWMLCAHAFLYLTAAWRGTIGRR